MVRGLLAALVATALLSTSARADTSREFGAWRDKAQPIESLSQFLSDFIGSCDSDPLSNKECKAKVEAYRKKSMGQVYYVILGEDAQKMIQPKGFNPRTHEQEFALTPFFEGSGYALTEGQPQHTDSDGNPVMPMMRMTTKFGDNVTHEMIVHEFGTGNVKVQLVFRPTGIWRLPRKDKAHAFYEGVKAQFLAVRMSDTRSGAELGSLISSSK
jgi:hypothetical protein